MEIIFYILAKSVKILLDLISIAMLLRVIMPMISDVEDSFMFAVSLTLTEPLVYPVRILFDKLNFMQDTPIDIAFMTTYTLLFVIKIFLPVI